MSSDTFLEDLRRRDPAALAEAVRQHTLPLFRSARALGFSVSESEDLVQDVFVTFLERIDSFEGRSQLRTWLLGVLYRKAQEHRRAFARHNETVPLDDVLESRFDARGHWSSPPDDLERLLLANESGEMIRECLEGLTFNQRQSFVLREVESLPTEEICKILSVSVTNFGVLLHRTRARLRDCLERKGRLKR
jgi:RNA polymerase sigma-70 factor (ECF subfamily)